MGGASLEEFTLGQGFQIRFQADDRPVDTTRPKEGRLAKSRRQGNSSQATSKYDRFLRGRVPHHVGRRARCVTHCGETVTGRMKRSSGPTAEAIKSRRSSPTAGGLNGCGSPRGTSSSYSSLIDQRRCFG